MLFIGAWWRSGKQLYMLWTCLTHSSGKRVCPSWNVPRRRFKIYYIFCNASFLIVIKCKEIIREFRWYLLLSTELLFPNIGSYMQFIFKGPASCYSSSNIVVHLFQKNPQYQKEMTKRISQGSRDCWHINTGGCMLACLTYFCFAASWCK